jgi:phytoene dehydrogenase-like protein
MAANTYDAIIIGGGHNGLVSGAYFARDGLRTVVLEARNKTGGAADTSAPFADHPEINVTTYSYVMSLMPPTIIRELRLKEFGYDVTPFGPVLPGLSGRTRGHRLPRRIAEVLRLDRRVLEAGRGHDAEVGGMAPRRGRRARPLMLRVPPHVGSMHPMDLLSTVQVAWKMRQARRARRRRRHAAVHDERHRSAQRLVRVRCREGMLAVNGRDRDVGRSGRAGHAYVMLHHSIGDVGDGHLGSWGFQQGGMGGVSSSIRSAAEAFGCEIRTGARVKKIVVRNGRAVGVVLDDGQELRAPVVVSCIHPQIAFLDLVDRHELPPDFVWDIERWKTRSGVVKINVAISELPGLQGATRQGAPGPSHGLGRAVLLTDYAEEAFQDAHMHRKASVAPFVDGTIPTTMDKKLAPKGTHVFSMFTQWVPDDWVKEPHRDELDAYAKRIFDLYDELAPNFKDSIIDYQVIGPYDMEQELGLIGGNIFHGELSADQLFHMRPAPATGTTGHR